MNAIRNICSFLSSVIGIYSFIVCVRIIMSWFKYARFSGGFTYEDPNRVKSWSDKLYDFLRSVTDPYLDLFKKVKSLRRSRVDFTPVLGLILLNIANTVFSMIARTGRMTIGVVIAIVIDSLWGSLINFILIILLALLVIRFIAGLRNSQRSQAFVDAIDRILDKPVGKVYKLFFKKSTGVNDQKLVLVSFLFYLVLQIVLANVESALVSWLVGL